MRTNNELLQVVLTATDEETEWEAISALHRQGGRDVLDQARRLCVSGNAHQRRVGADLLGQLGIPENTYHEEALATLLAMLNRERDPVVLSAISVALGHRHDPRAIEPMLFLRRHPDSNVRLGSVFGLMGHEDMRAIQALIELSNDVDADVRDWATFSLGSQVEADTPAVREALIARLTDGDENVRSEAMVGLARRHDRRMLEPLRRELEAGRHGSLLMTAATEIGDPSLYPALTRLRDTWRGNSDNWLYKELEEAIARCQPTR